jgi:eukaryotic-like serine/threonine-protein kinase
LSGTDEPRTLAPEAGRHDDALPDQAYTELDELGRGGAAQVMRVFDTRLGREVALKRLHAAPDRPAAHVRDFFAEARLTAQLEHPHIVPVHSAGIDQDGTPFFTMKRVTGLTLRRWLVSRDSSESATAVVADALEVLLKLCDALSLAHARGIAHCDIKPDNVMIGEYGEVYLMDWGIAQRIGSPASPAGTPNYMPPEVATGGLIDERTDVFALGALLYFVVARRGLYTGGGVANIVHAAKRAAWVDLVDLGLARPPPAALAAIVRKAIQAQPSERYATVGEFAHAVRTFLRSGLHLPERVFPAGTVVLRQGDLGLEGYIIVTGRADAWRDLDGRPQFIRTMGPGDVFGEYALLANSPRSASVRAVTELTTLVLDRATLETGLGFNSWVGSVVRALAERFVELDRQLNARG